MWSDNYIGPRLAPSPTRNVKNCGKFDIRARAASEVSEKARFERSEKRAGEWDLFFTSYPE